MTRGRAFAAGLGLLAVVALALLLWRLHALALMVFAAVLVAVLLDAAAGGLRRVLPMGQVPAVLLVILALLLLFGLGIALLGAQTVSELSELSARLPESVRAIEERLGIGRIEGWIGERMQQAVEAGTVMSGISGVTSVLAAAATALLVALAGGVFLALDPVGYREGVLRLLPGGARGKAAEVMGAIGAALRAWLLGQLVAMTVVGAATALGLWMLGVATPIALGVIAGLLEFVPYIGPVVSAVPAVAVAFVDSPTTALWVVLLFTAIQQVEGAVLMPLIQREAVDVPPPVTIFAVAGFGMLFGVAGAVLAAPLTVVALVAVRRLWVPAMARRGPAVRGAEPDAGDGTHGAGGG